MRRPNIFIPWSESITLEYFEKSVRTRIKKQFFNNGNDHALLKNLKLLSLTCNKTNLYRLSKS